MRLNSSCLQTVAMYVVMKFYHMVRSGVSFKVNETFIELWQNSYESDENKSSTTISLCPDDLDDDLTYFNCDESHAHETVDIFECNDGDISDKTHDDGAKRAADEGSDENDSLLVAYDVNSVDSLWYKNVNYPSLSLCSKNVCWLRRRSGKCYFLIKLNHWNEKVSCLTLLSISSHGNEN